jgi:hypothetical protein
MFGKSRGFDYSLCARDRKMQALRSRLNLALIAANRSEVTRIGKELRRLGQSL